MNSIIINPDEASAFKDATVRRCFLRKVYFILAIQILVIFGFLLNLKLIEPAKQFFHDNTWILYMAMIFLPILVISVKYEFLREAAPVAIVFLAVHTFALSVILDCYYVTSFLPNKTMLRGVAAAEGVMATLYALSFYRIELSWRRYGLVSLLSLLITYGIAASVIPNPGFDLLGEGLIVFGLLLLPPFQPQVIIGGEMVSQDHYFAVLNIHVKLITMLVKFVIIVLCCIGLMYIIVFIISYAVYRHEVENNKYYQFMLVLNSIFQR